MVRRSVLISPGDQPDKLRKAATSGADAVVFDLEDGVAPDRKDVAREVVRDAIADFDADCELCVRVNPIGAGATHDLDAVLEDAAPDSVMLPKTSGPSEVRMLFRKLRNRNAPLPVIALVESAEGVLGATDIATAAPTSALVFGAEDLAGNIGATRSAEGSELAYARQHVVLAGRAAGVDLIDTHYTKYEDEAGLRDDARRGCHLGYDGKLAIHPAQIDAIHDAFRPDPERVEWARTIMTAKRDADAEDRGVFVVEGEMIDAPQIHQAERILERAGEGKRR
ncbi:citrate lyase subunit beta / citryl-CoA lyase [Halomicrobium zhouii]|uniref:Citrate lyase subunit beta / citryl-CoA lyase n=1 Tax=Halomicrobium zhouii TaxID=767519 RepID=A0A1I6LC66_9EURY|nr:CoA ester lyase [Halomicrobium zhouii]SFS01065.1 citrate lyase subunit beta / citryl-CoA lyase [Halomicrobium zhouii]